MLRFFVLTAIVNLTGVMAHGEPTVDKQPVPAWVELVELPTFPESRLAESSGGIAYLLSDRQITWNPGGYDYFGRFAYEVTDRTGLEDAARLTPDFDPEQSSFSYNFINVVRDGVVQSRLEDAEITLLRQEEELDSGLIDGDITALVELSDVRVGDIIEYGYSGYRETSLWPAHYFRIVSTEFSVPIALRTYTLNAPHDFSLQSQGVETDLEVSLSEEGDRKIYHVRVENPDPVSSESNVPEDLIERGYIEISSMTGWSDVVGWADPLYKFDEALPKELLARLDGIQETTVRPEEMAVEALRLVQSEIRYLGIESGLGSHAPRSPNTTLDLGYGDCKDKTVLLVAILRHLGIEAYPVLAHTSSGHTLEKSLPSIGAFDHVITQFSIGGNEYWVDPTLTHQGGRLDRLAAPEYGYVLPIRPDQNELVLLSENLPDNPDLEIVETYNLPEEGNIGFSLEVTNRYEREYADWIRRQIAQTGIANIGKNSLDFYARSYPGISEKTSIQVTDDFEENIVTLTKSYDIERSVFDKNEFGTKLPVHAFYVQDILPDSVEADRRARLAIPFGTNRRHVINIGTPGRSFTAPESQSFSAPGISFVRNFGKKGDILEIEYLLVVNEKSVEQKSIGEVIDLESKISELTDLSINASVAVPTIAKRLGLESELRPSTEEKINEGVRLLTDGKNVEALAVFNTLAEEETEPGILRGYIQMVRGAVLADLNRDKAAIAPYKEAFQYYSPPETTAYFSYLTILRNEGDDLAAADILIKLLQDHPDSILKLNVDWVSSFGRDLFLAEENEKRGEIGVALAAAQLAHLDDMEDPQEWFFSEAVKASIRNGDLKNAEQYLPHIYHPIYYMDLLMDKEFQPIWATASDLGGPRLQEFTSRFVERARERASEAPDDIQKQSEYLDALRYAGKFQAAVEVGRPIVEDWSRIEAVGRDGYWLVNNYAYALSEIGDLEGANSMLEKLTDLGISENADLINMAINHASILLNWERYDDALQVVSELEGLDDENIASDFGWMWIYDTKACSLYQLGKTELAAQIITDDIQPIASSNPSAYMKTLLCTERYDEAKALMIERLGSQKDEGAAIAAFLELKSAEHTPPFLDELIARARSVQSDPKVRAAFDAVARTIDVDAYRTYWGSF